MSRHALDCSSPANGVDAKIDRYMKSRRLALVLWFVSLVIFGATILVAVNAPIDDETTPPYVYIGFGIFPIVSLLVIAWKGVPRRCPFCDNLIEGIAYPIRGKSCPICEMPGNYLPKPADRAFPVVFPYAQKVIANQPTPPKNDGSRNNSSRI